MSYLYRDTPCGAEYFIEKGTINKCTTCKYNTDSKYAEYKWCSFDVDVDGFFCTLEKTKEDLEDCCEWMGEE